MKKILLRRLGGSGIRRRGLAASITSSSSPSDARQPPSEGEALNSSATTGTPSTTTTTTTKPFQRQRIDRRYTLGPKRVVPSHIGRPPYAETGKVPLSFWSWLGIFPEKVQIHTNEDESIAKIRKACRLARQVLDLACTEARVGMTTDQLDDIVHQAICDAGAYPSPLNYKGYPKSFCSSINEVVCHGIPNTSRPLQLGDVASLDVSCYLDGVHGDNCATIIIGDYCSEALEGEATAPSDEGEKAWRGVSVKTNFASDSEKLHFEQSRRLLRATRESLYAAIDVCRPGNYLSDIGDVIHDIADRYQYGTVEKVGGHGIGETFHCAPYIKHYRNKDRLRLQPGMIFTIEPMFTIGSARCFEWEDRWTLATIDYSLSAQFEHTILITDGDPEILTLPD